MIYLDNAATTKPLKEVLETYNQMNEKYYFNPNSPHQSGIQISNLVDKAKRNIIQYLELNDKYDVIFTSGATEANNIAIQGMAKTKRKFGKTILTSKLEHPSVLETMRALEIEGFNLEYIDVTEEGKIDLNHLKELLSEDVILVSCMHVNNIMGQIQPIGSIHKILKDYPKVHFHVDGVQGFGKIPLDVKMADSYSLSAHKFHGLKGSGLLVLNQLSTISPIIFGGGQEYGIRSGTVNAPINVAMAKAMRFMIENQTSNYQHLVDLNFEIRKIIESYKGVLINSPKEGAPHIINISFPGVKGEVLVNAFSKLGVMVSTTSACSSKKSTHNETLKAMGLSIKRIEGSIRISLTREISKQDLEEFKKDFDKVYKEVRELIK